MRTIAGYCLPLPTPHLTFLSLLLTFLHNKKDLKADCKPFEPSVQTDYWCFMVLALLAKGSSLFWTGYVLFFFFLLLFFVWLVLLQCCFSKFTVSSQFVKPMSAPIPVVHRQRAHSWMRLSYTSPPGLRLHRLIERDLLTVFERVLETISYTEQQETIITLKPFCFCNFIELHRCLLAASADIKISCVMD